MDTAHCAEDGKDYDAHTFSLLPRPILEKRRRFLICIECKAAAYFRKESSDGRAACFGARPHAEGCNLVGAEAAEWGSDGSDVEEERRNSGNHIFIDLAYGGTDDNSSSVVGGEKRAQGQGRTFRGNGSTKEARSHKRLSSLLRWLMLSEAFRKSTQVIELPGRITLPAYDLFVPIAAIDDSRRGQLRGYWGMISDAGYSTRTGHLWLNTAGYEGFSFRVEPTVVDSFKARYGIDSLEQVAGAYILFFGKIFKSSSKTGKLFCAIDDIGYVAVSLSKD